MNVQVVIAAVLLAGTLLIARWMRHIRPLPIAELELAFSPAKVERLLVKWNANAAVRRSVYIDFLFVPCYTALLWLLCTMAENRRFAVAALVAGALDFFVENPIMLLELDGRSNAFLTFVKALASLIKWLLLGAVVIDLVYVMEQEL